MAEMKKPQTISELIADANVEDMLNLARVLEHAERYEDMCVVMGKIVELKKDIVVEERNMLSVAYKNVVGQRRAAWRAMKEKLEEDNKEAKQMPSSQELASAEAKRHYRNVVEAELQVKCEEILSLLSKNLLTTSPAPTDEGYKALQQEYEQTKNNPEKTKKEEDAVLNKLETQVFYLKMSGDYYRYLAEFKQKSQDMANQAKNHYEKAIQLSKTLAPTHPTRLGLALNASVCYWEILKKPDRACNLAKKAFDDAIQKLDALNDTTYKDSTLIMQLLRDNLTIWTNHENDTTQTQDGKKVEHEED